MAVSATVLFNRPQREIATLIKSKFDAAVSASIVTGFATPAGLALIADPIKRRPNVLDAFIVGAATYPAFEAIDDLLAAGVPSSRLYLHLGHTQNTGTRDNPFVRYHPMLHSKIYYVELQNELACAFVGSHNVTAFALAGANGEASVMLEGNIRDREFDEIRAHIDESRRQAQVYSSHLKDAYSWWLREYLDGLKVEVGLPSDWKAVRTILVFSQLDGRSIPRASDAFYFEIPAGIGQIKALETEVHLFLFRRLPSSPAEALGQVMNADHRFRCITKGADNRSGMVEVDAQWHIDDTSTAVMAKVPSGRYRPVRTGKQQVLATIQDDRLAALEYSFVDERRKWMPAYSEEWTIHVPQETGMRIAGLASRDSERRFTEWKHVERLDPLTAERKDTDSLALESATPESGNFILVALRTRRRRTDTNR